MINIVIYYAADTASIKREGITQKERHAKREREQGSKTETLTERKKERMNE
jgi:hypothetical protein